MRLTVALSKHVEIEVGVLGIELVELPDEFPQFRGNLSLVSFVP